MGDFIPEPPACVYDKTIPVAELGKGDMPKIKSNYPSMLPVPRRLVDPTVSKSKHSGFVNPLGYSTLGTTVKGRRINKQHNQAVIIMKYDESAEKPEKSEDA